ncbi:MAG: hypothetical protein D6694_01770, partial [Gammaproteobacteria bacterium]
PTQPPLPLFQRRTLVWFSCGAASAVAAKITLEERPDAEILYCRVANEHPDNLRFLRDVERWLDVKIKILTNPAYPDADIFSVFWRTGWLVGPAGARCTVELKRRPREQYQQPGDVHVFGMTADEELRIRRFEQNNPELYLWWPLLERGITKQDCFDMLNRAGITLPAMYQMGYRNNNCIGCVKGGKGYWNKIRRDFPEAFERMAKFEREMGARVFPDNWLDELPPDAGRYESEYEIECGPVCGLANSRLHLTLLRSAGKPQIR